MGNFKINVSDAPIFILTWLPRNGGHGALAIFSSPLLPYAIAIVGNILILLIVKGRTSLHQPMYYLSLLSVNDLGVSFPHCRLCWLPSASGLRVIAFNVCLAQMFSSTSSLGQSLASFWP